MRPILLATHNPAKQEALRRLLDGLPLRPIAPRPGALPDSAEDAGSFLGNARAKALSSARASGTPAIASDGGLIVPVLGGSWDALRSRRFAGPTDTHRIAALIERLKDVPPERRTARFREAVAVAEPNGRIVAEVETEGDAGRLAETPDPRALPGFWVTALWLYPPRWVTEWDLEPEERAAVTTAWDAAALALLPALLAWASGT